MPKIQLGDQEVDIDVGPDGAELTVGESKVKVDAQGSLIGADVFGTQMEKVEGGMLITRPNGTKFLMGDDGGYTLMTPPKAVGISDISKVASYTIGVDGDGPGSIHRITFGDGGYANISFTGEGEFAGLSGHHLKQTFTEENELFIGQFVGKTETVQ